MPDIQGKEIDPVLAVSCLFLLLFLVFFGCFLLGFLFVAGLMG